MECKFRFNIGRWRGIASVAALPLLLVWSNASGTATSGDSPQALEKQFHQKVRPFLQQYCTACHGKDKPQAQLDLASYANMSSVVRDLPHWTLVLEKIAEKQMPPAGSSLQPTAAQREAVMSWIRAVRRSEIMRNAEDPGPVLARRLSNSEYDYSIYDITGVDLRPTKEFPVDPANQEGFDNSGESLTLSPALMKKYAQAARDVADHVALTSTGLEFASHPLLAETDRDKFCILRIVDFYRQQPTDFADYFFAAWRYQNRAALGMPQATLKTIAADTKVSPRYLEMVWKTLTDTENNVGPIKRLRDQWKALPAPDQAPPDKVKTACIDLRDWVRGLRKKVAWKFDNLPVPGGFSTGGQCFVLWKDRQYASHRRSLNPTPLQIGGVPFSKTIPERRSGDKVEPAHVVSDPIDPDLFVPAEETERVASMAAFTRFCNVFPDAFYIAERGRMFMDDPNDQGRLLTAGLHNSMGYFRDDTPLMEMILGENGRQKLDHLWMDFDMVAFVPERMHSEFFVYERAESATITDPEFNFARAEDKEALTDPKIFLLRDLYLAKAKRNGAEPPAIQAIEEHFVRVSNNIRATERARIAAEPVHRRSLLEFASRAYRRPLTEAEKTGLLAFYRSLREKDGLTHEEAIRDTVIAILMSPHFLFRMDLEANTSSPAASSNGFHLTAWAMPSSDTAPPRKGEEPLSDYALASRLSYFLWSSVPDKELLSHAAAGDLHRPEVLAAQAKRMMRDTRIRRLALEFAGNWLDFRRFEEHNAVDRDRFPTFTNDLREAMFEEPLRFLTDEFQGNRSILEALYGKHTFVNASLARHYGMKDVKTSEKDWVRVDDASKYGRGGMLPMAVFLTKNSPGLRTSPVKRGYWVVRRLLGESIPPPPAVVPELPKDESKMGDLTLRQALEEHRKNPACAGCHARFDSYGLVFEGYGPIGEIRETDLGGKKVDTRAPFPGGKECADVNGLRDYIRQKRQRDFVDTFSRKLLSYALGRSLLPSDEPTLQRMQERLTASGYRVGALVETIVTSRQFRNRRASATPVAMSVRS